MSKPGVINSDVYGVMQVPEISSGAHGRAIACSKDVVTGTVRKYQRSGEGATTTQL